MIARCLDLADIVDSVGATFDTERPAGAFNAWGNSFPAEELPFGRRTVVDGISYELVDKAPRQPDHFEALGQRLPVGPPHRPVNALALLAAGEMGPQELTVRVHLATGVQSRSVVIRGWEVRPETPVTADQLRGSHLHYPGDYDLALLVPVLWSHVLPLPGGPVTAIEPLANPLVHIFAITLLTEVDS